MASKQNEIGGWDMTILHDEKPAPKDAGFRRQLLGVVVEALCMGAVLWTLGYLIFGIEGGM